MSYKCYNFEGALVVPFWVWERRC